MKLKVYDRLLLALGAVLVLVSGICLFLLGLLIEGIPLQGLTQEPATLNRWVLLLAGGLLTLYGLYVLLMPHRYRRRREDFIVQQTATGELRISVRAIENLVQKCVSQHSDMSLKGIGIESRRDGVVIDLRLALPGNISIPLAVSALQKQVKDHLIAASGVDVREVRVSVETADSLAKGSPYETRMPEALKDRPDAETPAEAAKSAEALDESREQEDGSIG